MATHYTPIPTGTGVSNTSDLFNTRLQSLDDAIVAIELGNSPITGLNLGTPSTLTLSANTSGAVTITASRHRIDTFAAATSGDLATINGGIDGDILLLQSVNAARVPTIKQTGNIYTLGQADIILEDPKIIVGLVYDGTNGKWVAKTFTFTAYKEHLAAAPQAITVFDVQDRVLIASLNLSRKRLGFAAHPEVASRWGFRASAATVQSDNVAAPTIANTPTADMGDDFPSVNFPTTAATGNLGGFVTPTFNLVRRSHNPIMTCVMRTSVITNLRFWVGLISADVTAVDTIAGATEFAGFRFSTVAGDTTFKAITKDASTQNAGVNVGAAVVASTAYVLRMRIDSANGLVYFSVNGSAEVSLNANLPAVSTNLGLVFRPIATTTTIASMSLSRLYVEGK